MTMLAFGMVVGTLLMMKLVGNAAAQAYRVIDHRSDRPLADTLKSSQAGRFVDPPWRGVLLLPPRSDYAGNGSGVRMPGAVCAVLGEIDDVSEPSLKRWEAACDGG